MDKQLNSDSEVITADNKVILLSKVEHDPAFERLVFCLNRLSIETYKGMRVTAVIGCGYTGLGVAESVFASTYLTAALGAEVPLSLATLEGIVAATGCLTTVIISYRAGIDLLEAEYQLNLGGCPCDN